MTGVLWLIAGLAVGTAEVWMLARKARVRARALELPLRLGFVAAFLVCAALSGRLLAATLGWAIGFVLALVAGVRRRA